MMYINAKWKHTDSDHNCRCQRCASWDSWWCEDWLAWPLLHTRGGWYPHHIICQLVINLRKICSWCARRPRRVVLVIHFFSQCKGINVQYQAMVDIRATTEAHTDIVNVLLSINDTDTVASLYDIGKLTVIKMPRKEGLIFEFQKLVLSMLSGFKCEYPWWNIRSKCGGELCIIGDMFPLLNYTQQCSIHRKYPQMPSAGRNIESSTSRVTTWYRPNKVWLGAWHHGILLPRTHYLVHFLHLQIYCSSSTTFSLQDA